MLAVPCFFRFFFGQVNALRAMLAVPYFEKALYELPESELSSEKVASLADEVEVKMQGGFSPRPLLSVVHVCVCVFVCVCVCVRARVYVCSRTRSRTRQAVTTR